MSVHNATGRDAYRILVGRHEGKRACGRCRCRWEDNIRMDLGKWAKKMGDWMHLVAEDRDQWQALVNMVMTLLVP
jgi:hypothetical protein